MKVKIPSTPGSRWPLKESTLTGKEEILLTVKERKKETYWGNSLV
jgi:hypothetical protein